MNKPEAVLVDVDGTLANVASIRHHVRKTPDHPFKNFGEFHARSVDCPPNAQAVDIAREAHAAGLAVLVVTARRAMWRHHTAWFLALHGIPSDAMFMRGNDDHRRDVEVKADILARIRQSWNVVHAVDDNPAVINGLWIPEGIPTTIIPGWEE